MTPEQGLAITRIARAAWPAQRWDEYTIDIWVRSLDGEQFAAARAAIDSLVTKQTFASIAELLAEMRLSRRTALAVARDRRTFAAIEAARHEHDAERCHAAYLEARARFDQAIAEARAARGETESTEATA